jgi:hypothetical protein
MIKLPFIKTIAKRIEKDFKSYLNFEQEKENQNIYEQVLLFAQTLLPNEKIIVSREDYQKILSCKDERGYYLVSIHNCEFYVSQFQLKCETVNNFPRAEFGEKKTNRNFELLAKSRKQKKLLEK